LANGLQRFKPRALLGRMDTHTRRRAMVHRDKDRHLPILAGVGRRHSGPPHRIDLRRDDGPIMGFGAMRMSLPRGGQQMMGPPQAQDPARRRAETAIPQPGPHLAVPFAWGMRLRRDTP
jgi:hypothetical protein